MFVVSYKTKRCKNYEDFGRKLNIEFIQKLIGKMIKYSSIVAEFNTCAFCLYEKALSF
jgi:DNA-dependent RNA polymerase auxiliary subunit epsilon